MTLWCLMLVLQAYLIRSNRRRLHRLIGRSSLVLVPILVIQQLLVVHHAARTGVPFLDSQGALTDFGAVFVALVLGIAPLFAGLYALAIYFTIACSSPAALYRNSIFFFSFLRPQELRVGHLGHRFWNSYYSDPLAMGAMPTKVACRLFSSRGWA